MELFYFTDQLRGQPTENLSGGKIKIDSKTKKIIWRWLKNSIHFLTRKLKK